jgi:hypothetical protein
MHEIFEGVTAFAAAVASIAAVISCGISWRNGIRVSAVAVRVEEVQAATNGMKAELIAATAKGSDLEGERRGIAIGVEQATAAAADKKT